MSAFAHALVHPFYNNDLVRLILQTCLTHVGCKTMTMCASVSRFTWARRIDLRPAEIAEYRLVRGGAYKHTGNWDLALATVFANSAARSWVHKHLQDDIFLRKVMTVDPWAVLDLAVPTIDDFIRACSMYGNLLRHVPMWAHVEPVIRAAVTQNGTALMYARMDMRNKDICTCAVTENVRAISYVPKKMRCGSLYDLIAKSGWMYGIPLRKITQTRIGYALEYAFHCYDQRAQVFSIFGYMQTCKINIHACTWKYALAGCKTKLSDIVSWQIADAEFWVAAVETKHCAIGHVPVRLQPIVRMSTCN